MEGISSRASAKVPDCRLCEPRTVVLGSEEGLLQGARPSAPASAPRFPSAAQPSTPSSCPPPQPLARCVTALPRPPFCCPLDVLLCMTIAPACFSPACRLCRRRAALKCACKQQWSACLHRCLSAVRPVIQYMCLCNGGPYQCRDEECVRVLCACAMCPPECPCFLELSSRCRGQFFPKVQPRRTGRLASGRQGGQPHAYRRTIVRRK